MTAEPFDLNDHDRALASRDRGLPGLPHLLDDGRLSALIGETVQVTRLRYKPGTSLLVAFRRLRNGSTEYGWAMTRAEAGNSKLLNRARASRARGGSVQVVRADNRRPATLIATGGAGDDPSLQRNLAWLRTRGMQRLGHGNGEGSALACSMRILRYKPGRRLVFATQTQGSASVIKTASGPADFEALQLLRQHLTLHGVPVLPSLGDAECARHGITAAPSWGNGDLAGTTTTGSAELAGKALARLHGTPCTGADTGSSQKSLGDRLAVTRSMIAALLPDLEKPARALEAVLGHRLAAYGCEHPAVIHGDFSADQVLIGESEIRLIDFDRVSTGPAEADLGSFAAVEESAGARPGTPHAGGPKTAGLTRGYLHQGGQFSQDAVDAWAAYRLFTGSVDPFRDRSPAWADELNWHLRRAQELIP